VSAAWRCPRRRDAVPEPAQVDAFVDVCRAFLRDHPDEYIGTSAPA
jgi:hypothetical protein